MEAVREMYIYDNEAKVKKSSQENSESGERGVLYDVPKKHWED